MQYLDSKIIGFINFFYDEVQKQKMPWVVKVVLFDPATMGGLRVDILRTDIDLNYTNYFAKSFPPKTLQNVHSKKSERSSIVGA